MKLVIITKLIALTIVAILFILNFNTLTSVASNIQISSASISKNENKQQEQVSEYIKLIDKS